jgi:hypothetical protein
MYRVLLFIYRVSIESLFSKLTAYPYVPSILWTLCNPFPCHFRHYLLPRWNSPCWPFLDLKQLLVASENSALKYPRVSYRILSSLDFEVTMPDHNVSQSVVHRRCYCDIPELGEHNVLQNACWFKTSCSYETNHCQKRIQICRVVVTSVEEVWNI